MFGNNRKDKGVNTGKKIIVTYNNKNVERTLYLDNNNEMIVYLDGFICEVINKGKDAYKDEYCDVYDVKGGWNNSNICYDKSELKELAAEVGAFLREETEEEKEWNKR